MYILIHIMPWHIISPLLICRYDITYKYLKHFFLSTWSSMPTKLAAERQNKFGPLLAFIRFDCHTFILCTNLSGMGLHLFTTILHKMVNILILMYISFISININESILTTDQSVYSTHSHISSTSSNLRLCIHSTHILSTLFGWWEIQIIIGHWS